MEISNEIYSAHRRLSSYSVKFLEYVKNNPIGLVRANYSTLLADSHFGHLKKQPWPIFINREIKEELQYAATNLCKLVKRIPERFFGYNLEKISRYYEISEDNTYFMLYGVDNDYLDSLLSRGDFIFSSQGKLYCIEFNLQANLGGWELDRVQPLYIESPFVSKFLEKYQLRVCKSQFFPLLLEHSLQTFMKKNPVEHTFNLVFVFPEFTGIPSLPISHYLKDVYSNVLHQKADSLNGDCIICGFDMLKVVDDVLFCENKRIHILIEMSNGRVPFLFLNAVKEGNLVLFNGPITYIASNKLNLALLSEHENSDIFTPEEKKIIQTYIPWTRKVIPGDTTYKSRKIRLEDFILSHQKQLVLKPSDELGGNQVYLGCHCTVNDWTKLVKKALIEKKWVIQEYIPSPSYLFQAGETGCAPYQKVWGIFVFGDSYAGGYARILPADNKNGVINAQQGAVKTIILEIEE